MGDLTPSATGIIQSPQYQGELDTKEVSWNNIVEPGSFRALDNSIEEQWNVIGLSPNGSFYKSLHGNEVKSIEPTDGAKRDSFLQKWTKRKKNGDAMSPVISPVISRAKKDVHPKADVKFSDAALKKLTTDSKNLVKRDVINKLQSPRKMYRSFDKTTQGGKQAKIMSAERTKRRKSKNEEELKPSKKVNDDLENASTKGVCIFCGVGITEGARGVCKSCLGRQKKEKPKQDMDSPAPKKTVKTKTEETSQEKADSSVNVNRPLKNRSLSLDLRGNSENLVIVKKPFQRPKRMNTDLESKKQNGHPQDDSNVAIDSDDKGNPSFDDSSSSGTIVVSHVSHESGPPLRQKVYDEPTSVSNKKHIGEKTTETSKPQMKRSTTDSEIVSKGKSKENETHEPKASQNINRLQALDSSKRKESFKEYVSNSQSSERELSDHNLMSNRKTSSSETVNEPGSKSTFKLERSKTTFGKLTFDRDRKFVADSEKPRIADSPQENLSTETNTRSDKPTTFVETKNKKFLNPSRAHTIIGDGNPKRQKTKSDSTKSKKEGSFYNVTKEKREEPVKKNENMEEIEPIKLIVVPKTLYDIVSTEKENEFSSDSENETNYLQGNGTEDIYEQPAGPTILHDAIEKRTSNSEMFSNKRSYSKWSDENDRSQRLDTNKLSEYGVFENNSRSQFDHRIYDNNIDRVPSDSEVDFSERAIMNGDVENQSPPNEFRENSETSLTDNVPRTLEIITEESEDEVSAEHSPEPVYFEHSPFYTEVVDSETENVADQIDYHESESIYCNQQHNYEADTAYTYTSPVLQVNSEWDSHYSNIEPKAVTDTEYTEDNYTGDVAQKQPSEEYLAQNTYAFETDVDTGATVMTAVQEDENSYADSPLNPWGFRSASNSNSFTSSEDEKEKPQSSDSWCGDDYYTDYKSKLNEVDDAPVYFEHNVGKDTSDSDIYTGGFWSPVGTQGNDQRDMTKNNNTSIHEHAIEGSNFWNISSRPQMHRPTWRPQTGQETRGSVDTICPGWMEGQCSKMFNMVENFARPICDVSNNYNGKDDEEDDYKPPASSSPISSFTEITNQTEYTEYSRDLFADVREAKPKKEFNFFGFKDFSKYDKPQSLEHNSEEGSSFSGMNYITDIRFFGDEPKKCNKPKPQTASPDKNLYFSTQLLSGSISAAKAHHSHFQKDDDYQGGLFSTSKYYGFNNSNNNAEGESESYTGTFQNKEGLKPTHEGLFNGKATNFVFQKRIADSTPKYFFDDNRKSYYDKGDSMYAFDANSAAALKKLSARPEVSKMYYLDDTSKSYYDKEDSVYAFEEKTESRKLDAPKVPQVFKVGGIIVRNNVEREIDYAQNINMDLQQEPTPWVRYDMKDDANEVDTSSYAQNVSYENLAGIKPWVVDGSRTPWRDVKNQDMKKSKEKDSTWNDAPPNNNVVKSVKSFSTYVRRWF